MPDVVIENPIINSPFEEPRRHFYFDQTGITDKIVEARRNSAYFVPIPPSKKKSGGEQLVLGTEWRKDRQKENKFINDIRNAVAKCCGERRRAVRPGFRGRDFRQRLRNRMKRGEIRTVGRRLRS